MKKQQQSVKMFEGESGQRHLVQLLSEQKSVLGDLALAGELAEVVTPRTLVDGEVLITEGARETDLYFILDGKMHVSIKGRKQGERVNGNTVGEMAAIQPAQPRSATVKAIGDCVVARLSETDLELIANKYPKMWHQFARELARRLLERNRSIAQAREKIRVFVISSREAIDVVEAIENAFANNNDMQIVAWKNDVFKVANYPLEDLERELELADFAVAVAHADDVATIRKKRQSIPRDNVIFELAYFMGRLGRRRSILIEPSNVKLPSDYDGVTTIRYKFDKLDKANSMSVACNKLRDHIRQLGPFNE
jgi:CRP/FNR family transcriptional regulator, cyclic AMP receptor protein